MALTTGTDNYKRLTADLNKVLTPDLSLRLNLMDTKADAFRDGVSQSRWGIAPALAWGAGTSNEISLAYYSLQGNNVPDFGVPYFRGKPLNVPV